MAIQVATELEIEIVSYRTTYNYYLELTPTRRDEIRHSLPCFCQVYQSIINHIFQLYIYLFFLIYFCIYIYIQCRSMFGFQGAKAAALVRAFIGKLPTQLLALLYYIDSTIINISSYFCTSSLIRMWMVWYSNVDRR